MFGSIVRVIEKKMRVPVTSELPKDKKEPVLELGSP